MLRKVSTFSLNTYKKRFLVASSQLVAYGGMFTSLPLDMKHCSNQFSLQYMFPNLSGHLPKSAADTAWPHNTVGHQTLFSPAQTQAQNDDLFVKYTGLLNKLTYDRQNALKKVIPDYPNYISLRTVAGMSKTKAGAGPKQVGWDGSRVWGANVARLQTIKEKYDPKCLLKQGPVFSSKTCTKKGLATIF